MVQRAAADGGALELLMALLEDESDAVRVAAASALKALSAHSAPATARLSVGGSIGIAQTPEKVCVGVGCQCCTLRPSMTHTDTRTDTRHSSAAADTPATLLPAFVRLLLLLALRSRSTRWQTRWLSWRACSSEQGSRAMRPATGSSSARCASCLFSVMLATLDLCSIAGPRSSMHPDCCCRPFAAAC